MSSFGAFFGTSSICLAVEIQTSKDLCNGTLVHYLSLKNVHLNRVVLVVVECGIKETPVLCLTFKECDLTPKPLKFVSESMARIQGLVY